MHHVQWKELVIMILIEPCALEIKQPQAGCAAQRQCIERELLDGFVGLCIRFVIKNVDRTVPDLEEINVASERCRQFDRDREAQTLL